MKENVLINSSISMKQGNCAVCTDPLYSKVYFEATGIIIFFLIPQFYGSNCTFTIQFSSIRNKSMLNFYVN